MSDTDYCTVRPIWLHKKIRNITLRSICWKTQDTDTRDRMELRSITLYDVDWFQSEKLSCIAKYIYKKLQINMLDVDSCTVRPIWLKPTIRNIIVRDRYENAQHRITLRWYELLAMRPMQLRRTIGMRSIYMTQSENYMKDGNQCFAQQCSAKLLQSQRKEDQTKTSNKIGIRETFEIPNITLRSIWWKTQMREIEW